MSCALEEVGEVGEEGVKVGRNDMPSSYFGERGADDWLLLLLLMPPL
jgi:hypothetical protein